MTRIFTSVLCALVLAAMLSGCSKSSSGGSSTSARTDVKPGSVPPPGSDLATASGSADPTGGKKGKAGEGDKKSGGG